MPLYVYRCATCGQEFEELQKLDEGAPDYPSDLSRCSEIIELRAEDPDSTKTPVTCKLERQLTTARHKFAADYSSDGIGGYERQGDAMIRQIPGKNSHTYGMDSRGRG